MSKEFLRSRLLAVTAYASEYCLALENAKEVEKSDFVNTVVTTLPKLYLEFVDIVPEEEGIAIEEEQDYFPSYVDEDYYENIRVGVESLLGPDDTFLETFEEDMKYSDTPIAASVSECLADIFQPLYNFISVVKDSEGEMIVKAYLHCREEFNEYWSQTLCNVLRPLNKIRTSPSED